MRTLNYRDTEERVDAFPFFGELKQQRPALVRKAADNLSPPVKSTGNCSKMTERFF